MKRLPIIITSIIICFLFAGCGPKSYDGPPDPGTPKPPSLDGIFMSEYGTMTFNGDGETVYINFSPEYLEILDNPPNEATYSYSFTWYSFGECRYDVATEFKLHNNESDTSLNFSLYLEGEGTTKDRIGFSYPTPDVQNIVFQRKSD
jgi:hypothetical protein